MAEEIRIVNRKGRIQFTQIENEIFDNENLTLHQKMIFCVLSRYANNNSGQAYPKIDTIAAKSGCSPRKVKYVIKELEAMNLITIYRSRPNEKKTVNTYVLNPQNEWNIPIINTINSSAPDAPLEEEISSATDAHLVVHAMHISSAPDAHNKYLDKKTENKKTKKNELKEKWERIIARAKKIGWYFTIEEARPLILKNNALTIDGIYRYNQGTAISEIRDAWMLEFAEVIDVIVL